MFSYECFVFLTPYFPELEEELDALLALLTFVLVIWVVLSPVIGSTKTYLSLAFMPSSLVFT
jgi:hypothetical protein